MKGIDGRMNVEMYDRGMLQIEALVLGAYQHFFTCDDVVK